MIIIIIINKFNPLKFSYGRVKDANLGFNTIISEKIHPTVIN